MPELKIVHGSYYSFLSEISDEYNVSFDALSKHAEKDSKVLIYAIKAKESLNSVVINIRFKNNLLQKFRQEISEVVSDDEMIDINFRILGVSSDDAAGNSFSDAVFYETVNNLVKATDDALFFFDKAMNSLEILANRILSPKLNMGLNKIKFISDDYKDYMPAPDHLHGW